MTTIDENDISLKNITRCPECNLVLSLSIYYKEITPYVNYYCENNHKGELSLEEYLNKYTNYCLSKEKCSECNGIQNNANANFYFCCKCNKFLCHSCINNHPNNNGHNITNINRYDALCKVHSNYYAFYCNKCQKNLCMYCKQDHQSHDIIDLIQYKNSYETTNKLEEKIKNIEKKINNLEEIKKQIIAEIDKFKKIYELEIKFFNILLNTFKYEEIQNNINYNVIENIKNYDETFGMYKMKIFDKINIESNKLITLFQTISIQKPFKIIKDERWVYYLLQLKDGRLASSSYYGTLKIYSKDTFEVQLLIRCHSERIWYITQLHNDNILTCSMDNTMNIIKLINDDKYNIEFKLIGHTSYVPRAMEIRNNEIISLSYDKTMKVWKLNNNNRYECINTITFQNSNKFSNILKLNENEFVTYSVGDKCLKFWNSYNYSNISTINNIESNWKSPLCKVEDDILCVGGKGFYLIKISTHQIIKNIMDSKRINSIYKCNDGLFLCLIIENGYSLYKFKYNKQNFNTIIKREKAFYGGDIYSNCIELNNEMIVSGLIYYDNFIYSWRN